MNIALWYRGEDVMKPERRHPQAVALDKWLETDEGKTCTEPVLLNQYQRTYLENRIRRAFAAGWDACEQARSKP